VVVPCFNESESLGALVARFSESEPGKNNFQLVLVDNGSTDGTQQTLARLCKSHAFVKGVRVEKNIGYGFGISSGLNAADGEFVGWTHADLQSDPLDAVKAYLLLCSQPDPSKCLAKGRRRNRPALDAFFTFGMSIFAALALGRWMEDINAQPNVFHRSFLQKLSGAPTDFSFDTYAYYMAQGAGMQINRFPVDFSRRLHGSSHWNTGLAAKWKFIKRTAQFTLELRKKLSEGKKC
jgi:glycosyltransferase involved in cell wall biosynthesis